MSPRPLDEEKGEAGFKVSEAEAGITTAIPVSPKSSQGSTFIGTSSSCSDDKQEAAYSIPSLFSRWIWSLRRSLGLERRSQHDEDNSSDDEDDSIVRKIHEQPNGYPKMATFLDSDHNFMIYRRFGYLQSRLLLERQDELRLLEDELDRLEDAESERTPHRLKSRLNISADKKKLLDDIEVKWTSYCQLLSNAATMTAMNQPTAGEQKSVVSWLYNIEPLYTPETHFIRCKEDLVTLRPGREHAWLDSSVERLLRWIRWAPVRQAFQSKDTRAKSIGDDNLVLYTRSRIEKCVVTIITFMIIALLVIPIWILYTLSQRGQQKDTSFECIGVLLVSTLAFSACISLFTRAKRHEILAASAAYCAVLVVFIGNIGRD